MCVVRSMAVVHVWFRERQEVTRHLLLLLLYSSLHNPAHPDTDTAVHPSTRHRVLRDNMNNGVCTALCLSCCLLSGLQKNTKDPILRSVQLTFYTDACIVASLHPTQC